MNVSAPSSPIGTCATRSNAESDDAGAANVAHLQAPGRAVASVDGLSFTQPSNDGSNPPPVGAGDGTVSVTCP